MILTLLFTAYCKNNLFSTYTLLDLQHVCPGTQDKRVALRQRGRSNTWLEWETYQLAISALGDITGGWFPQLCFLVKRIPFLKSAASQRMTFLISGGVQWQARDTCGFGESWRIGIWVIWWRGTKSPFRLCKCALYHHKSAKLESEAINKVCTVICRLHVE